MNPMLSEYDRHYLEAFKSANEAIAHLNKFGKHYSKLYDYDKKRLFQQVVADQAVPEVLRPILHYLRFGTMN